MPVLRGFKSAGRKVVCDICGQYWRQGAMRKGVFGKQKGLLVCPSDFDPVHPNDANIRPKTREGKLDEIR